MHTCYIFVIINRFSPLSLSLASCLCLCFSCLLFFRDKYMFHQANIIPAGDVGGDAGLSLLDYWYERVMQEFSKWVTFPVKVRRRCGDP